MQCLWKPEEGAGLTAAGAIGSDELLDMGARNQMGSLEEQCMFVFTEPSPQPKIFLLKLHATNVCCSNAYIVAFSTASQYS